MASFRNWARRALQLALPRTRRRPHTRLALEGLEDRFMPVIGVNTAPLPISPGQGLDGVVKLLSPIIGTTQGKLGTGTLLSTGRHILTAAHVLTDDNGVINVNSTTVTFHLPTGDVSLTVPRSNYHIHSWNGDSRRGNDIAILTLPEIAPYGAERFFINRATNEAGQDGQGGGQLFKFVGYGNTNIYDYVARRALSGAAGQGDNSGTKRVGYNHFVAASSPYLDVYQDRALLADFDNGTAAANTLRDPFWVGADYEAALGSGDSGGPAFLENGLIAGINVFSDDANDDGISGNIGDVNGFTRVSSFAPWIDAWTAEPGRLVLDMNNQPRRGVRDGRPDAIRAVVVGSEVQMFVNGAYVGGAPVSQVTGVEIRGSSNNEIIRLENFALVENRASFSIQVDGRGGSDSLTVYDTTLLDRASDARYAVTDGYVARSAKVSSGGYVSFTTYYTGIEALTVNTARLPAIVAVQSTPANVPVTIDAGHAGTAITVGNGGRLTDIRSPVTIGGVTGGRSVIIDDSADPNYTNVTMETVSVNGSSYGRVTFGGVPILSQYGTSTLTLHTGTGGALVNVLGTGVATSLVGHGANTTVVIGNGGRLTDIRGGITITNPPNYTAVVIDDSTDPYFYNVTVDTASINGSNYGRVSFGGVPILFKYADTNSMTLHTGTYGATVNVLATGVATSLSGNGPFTTVNIGNAGRLTNILGAITITNGSNFTAVNVDNSADGLARTVTVNSVYVGHRPRGAWYGEISFGGVPIRYKQADTSAVTLHTGLGGGTVNVLATSAPVTLVGHSPYTTVNVGNAGRTQSILGALSLVSPLGFYGVNVNNSADEADQNVTLSATGLTGLAPAVIDWSRTFLQSATVTTGGGADILRVEGSPTRGSLSVHSGGGDDEIFIGAPGQRLSGLGTVLVYSYDGADTVYLEDQGETRDQTYGLSQVIYPTLTTTGTAVVFHDTVERAVVHGSQGSNTWNVSSVPSRTTVELVAGTGLNDLVGPNLSAVWGLRAAGDGTLQDANSPNDAGVVFSGSFTQLLAGNQDDTFVFEDGAGFAGLIDGRGGVNTLDYSAYTTPVRAWLPQGQATGIGGAALNFRNALGGSGDDLFLGDGNGNTFDGGAGQDLLIAGGGPGVLRGGDGEDVLIGGTTALDGDPAALDAILANWSVTDVPYADRVAQLLVSLNRDTFVSNAGQNVMLGGAEAEALDLFFGSRARDVHDLNEDIRERFIDPDLIGQGQVINAQGLGVAQLNLDGVWYEVAAFAVNLEPGQHYVYVQGTVTYFTVTADGTFDYDDALEGALTGKGTSVLGVNGRPITVDVSALGLTVVNLDGVWHDLAGPGTFAMMPGQHYVYVQGTVSYFTLNADGTLDYDDALEGALTGKGTQQLGVNGRAVTVDAGALGVTAVNLDGVWYDIAGPLSLPMMPGQHYVYVQGTVSYFTLNADGTLDYDDALEGALTGKGTQQLGVNGRAVTVDVGALGLMAANLDGVWHDVAGPVTFAMMPGQHYAYVQGTVTYFTVNADGTLDYDDALEGALTGKGTSELGVNGRAVTVDVSALGLTVVNLDGVWYDVAGPVTFAMMPGQHYVYVQGTVTYFTVNADGTLDYDDALEGALTGRGTANLVASGREVTLDVSALGVATANIDGISHDIAGPLSLRMMAGQHYVYVEGVVTYFTVNTDGVIDYDAALDGVLTGRGTNQLSFLAV